MILASYRISPSRIPGAGQGVFLEEGVGAGQIIVAPDAIPRVYRLADIETHPNAAELLPATVRWFEEWYTATPEWPDECYINHAFEPTGLWHLGFVFARRALASGEELTVDYRHLLAPGQREAFDDAVSGEPIIGLPWNDSLRQTSAELLALMQARL